jgi:hypothetical protein
VLEGARNASKTPEPPKSWAYNSLGPLLQKVEAGWVPKDDGTTELVMVETMAKTTQGAKATAQDIKQQLRKWYDVHDVDRLRVSCDQGTVWQAMRKHVSLTEIGFSLLEQLIFK